MDKKQEQQNTRRFRIRFSPVIILLCVAVLLLCFLGIGVSVWRIIHFGIKGFNDVLKYPFLIAVCLFCIVIVVSLLIRSEYVATEKQFVIRFGIIKSKYEISDITSLLYDRDLKKLSVYFGEAYITVSVAAEWNEDLVRALLAVNPNIDYGFTLAEPPKDNDK